MTILTFCAYFEPEIAASMYLTTNIFEDAANAGFDVELFCPTPTRGVDKDTIDKYKKKKYEERCDGRLRIHRFALIREGKRTVVRALRYILLNLIFVWKGLFTKADIMFIDSTPPTQGFMATFLKKVKKIPIVYNLQDIFPDSLVNTGISTERTLVFKIGRWMERITYRNADKIIVISEDFKRNIMAKGVQEDKIIVVYNWVDEQRVHYVKRDENSLFDEFNLNRNKFYISYCGNIGLTQNIELLMDVANDLKKNDSIGFVLVGDGTYREELERQIKRKNLTNVTLIPFQPYEKISEVFSIGDVGLIISKPGVGTNSVPSKTWSYLAAERTVIASFDEDSELVDLLKKNHWGVSVTPNSKFALKKAIEQLYEHPELDYGKRGREFVDNNLTRKAGTKKYIDCIAQSARG